MKVIKGVDASEALQRARHKVFVEGSNDEAIDPIVITALFRRNELSVVDVCPMGCCENVRNAAYAMIRHHPSYYFVIDRDDQSEQQVDESWDSFPNSEKANLVIWRKRELENYFIDPNYISKSRWLRRGKDRCDIENIVQRVANSRVFLDAANLTLLSLHRFMREPICEHFKNISNFSSKDDGEMMLRELRELNLKIQDISNKLSSSFVVEKYEEFVDMLTDGCYPLEFGRGKWLELMSGKEIFKCISGECFSVLDRNGHPIQGSKRNIEVAKELLQLSLDEQPSDFKMLVEKIRKVIK